MSRAQVVSAMQKAAVNRGSLRGVARVAATVFDRADAWAFERASQLQANPLAAFTLHQKLIEADLTENAFALDAERLTALDARARQRGLGAQVQAVLQGLAPEVLEREITAMPLASAREAFSWEAAASTTEDPYARGLVDAMLRTPALPSPPR
jgi:superfamily I DNA/RNA helicase